MAKRETKIVYHTSNIVFGCHFGKSSKGVVATLKEFMNSPFNIMQFYWCNPRGKTRELKSKDYQDLLEARKLIQDYHLRMVIHSSLLNYITSEKYYVVTSTRDRLIQELDIGAVLGCPVIVHFGTRKDKAKGVKESVESIEHVLSHYTQHTLLLADLIGCNVEDFVKKRQLILENSAGEGNKMGYTLEGIAEIMNGVSESYQPQLSLCIDTAHLFGAGDYHLGKVRDVKRFFSDFDRIIGASRLRVIHLNDSEVALGSRADRHMMLGQGLQFSGGKILKSGLPEGMVALGYFVKQAGNRGVPLISESPGFTINHVYVSGGDYDLLVLDEMLGLYEIK